MRPRSSLLPFSAAIAAIAAIAVLAGGRPLLAQTVVLLPDTSRTTTLTADVSEQAEVTVPAGITFAVNNINVNTPAAAASVTVSNIVLASASKQLKVSVEAAAASFTPPVVGATTWDAADVSWNAATWTSATGATGTLSHSAFNQVATCSAGTAGCSTTNLILTLTSKPTVKISGNHTLVVNWKFESIGT